MAAGFAQELRERTLAEQEAISVAALQAQGVVAQALHATEARFRAVFEGAAIGIGMADLEGNILQVNGALLRMFGISDQTMGRPQRPRVDPPGRRTPDLDPLRRARPRRARALPRGEGVLPARRDGPVDQPHGLPAARRRRQPAVPARPHGGHHRAAAAEPAAALRGDPRRAHRPPEPHPVLRAPGEGARRGQQPAVRPVLPRPRRLQDHQRQPRPRGRRPAPRRGRRPAAVLRDRTRRDGRPARRRRVRGADHRTRHRARGRRTRGPHHERADHPRQHRRP